jgi:hypothetical protein
MVRKTKMLQDVGKICMWWNPVSRQMTTLLKDTHLKCISKRTTLINRVIVTTVYIYYNAIGIVIYIDSFVYLLTPWSRVLLEKLTSKLCSWSRNSPHLWNLKVPHRTHKCPPPVQTPLYKAFKCRNMLL